MFSLAVLSVLRTCRFVERRELLVQVSDVVCFVPVTFEHRKSDIVEYQKQVPTCFTRTNRGSYKDNSFCCFRAMLQLNLYISVRPLRLTQHMPKLIFADQPFPSGLQSEFSFALPIHCLPQFFPDWFICNFQYFWRYIGEVSCRCLMCFSDNLLSMCRTAFRNFHLQTRAYTLKTASGA